MGRRCQREILGLVAQGWTNAAIAEHLILAEKSVEKALTSICEHLGIDRRENARHVRVQAVLAYLRDGVWSNAPEPPSRAMPSVRADHSAASRASALRVRTVAAFLETIRTMMGADSRLAIAGAATSGREALELLSGMTPDIVLLDVQMPGMNGFEVAQAVRALAPSVRIVFTSSDDDPVYAAMALKLQAGFVPKRSLSPEAVLDVVERRT